MIKIRLISNRIQKLPVLQHAGRHMHQNQCSLFLNGAKRFYNVVRRNRIQHYLNAGGGYLQKLRRNPFVFGLVTCSVGISMYLCNLEDVPYTKRTHLVLFPRLHEEFLGVITFREFIKDKYEDKILPPDHPDNIRIQLISQRIIGALHRGLSSKEQVMWSYTDDFSGCITVLNVDKENSDNASKDKLHTEDERFKWLKWEFIVIEDPEINAFCLPGGKIVVFTGLINHLRDDTLVATVIGHEVGHAVARHIAERVSKIWWLVSLEWIVSQIPFVKPDTVKKKFDLIIFPLFRREELEADYIGLKLIASAGYDPRLAPQVYVKLKKQDAYYSGHLSTHPSAKKRVQLLTQTEVMKEALDLYREFKEGGIEDQYPKSHNAGARVEVGVQEQHMLKKIESGCALKRILTKYILYIIFR